MIERETFIMDKSEIEPIIVSAAEKAKQGAYGDIVEETMALARKRSKDFTRDIGMGLFEAPPLYFLLDVTLDIVTQPTIARRLPREVWRRGAVAQAIGMQIASTKNNILIYAEQFAEYGGIPNFAVSVMSDTTRHSNLIGNVFREAIFAGGGALKLLGQHRLFEGNNDTIKNSILLPKKIGACFGPSMETMYQRLGDPYILPEHLRLHAGKKKGTTIGYSKIAGLLLEQLRVTHDTKTLTDGCPVMHMPSPRQDGQTMFIDSWDRLVDFLVPSDATADAPQGSYNRYQVPVEL